MNESDRAAKGNEGVRILLVDDHPIVRRGVKDILAQDFPRADFGEAGDAGQAMTLMAAHAWDIVILDISLPGRSGLDLLADIRARRHAPPALILSMHPEEQYAVRTLKAGAAGYVAKDRAPEELAAAVRHVLGGGRYVSPQVAEALASEVAGQRRNQAHDALSDREFEVLRQLAGGKTVSQIAGQLALNVKTVSTYRLRLFQKLRVATNAELMRYAIENRLV